MAAQFSNIWRVRLLVLCIWVISILYNLPRFFEEHIVESGEAVVLVEYGYLNVSYVYWLVYRTLLFFVVRLALPLGILSFFTHHLVAALRLTAQRRQLATSLSLVNPSASKPEISNYPAPLDADERRIKMKLFAVVILYIITYLPVVYTGSVGVASHFINVDVLFSWSADLSDFILVINSSINVLMYYSMRQRLRRLCCRGQTVSAASVELNKFSRSVTAIGPTEHAVVVVAAAAAAATATAAAAGNEVRYMDYL